MSTNLRTSEAEFSKSQDSASFQNADSSTSSSFRPGARRLRRSQSSDSADLGPGSTRAAIQSVYGLCIHQFTDSVILTIRDVYRAVRCYQHAVRTRQLALQRVTIRSVPSFARSHH